MSKVTIDGRELSDKVKQELYICISCRLGIIETGEPSMRAIDAENSGKNGKIKALTLEQKELTIMLEKLMNKLL